MKHGKKTFVIIEAVLGILVILVLGFIIYKQNGHDPETIAVIIPDVDESEWSAFKYGLKMAAREYDTDVVIISKDNMETANEEIEIMNQEIAKGADAVIVKPIANRDGQQKLKQLEKSVPIMAVGDTFPEEPSGLHTIEPDHYHMGASTSSFHASGSEYPDNILNTAVASSPICGLQVRRPQSVYNFAVESL